MGEKRDEQIQQAITDLAMIRRAIDRTQSDTKWEVHGTTIDANLVAQIGALFLASITIGIELSTRPNITGIVLATHGNPDLRSLLLQYTGAILSVLLIIFYGIVWRAARQSEQEFEVYVAKHFHYLRNLSLASDLLIKFIIISAVLMTDRPEWVSPLLLLFTADFLIQGRFFTLPVKFALALGVCCISTAFALYTATSGDLIYPFSFFFLITGISVGRLYLSRKKLPHKREKSSAKNRKTS